MVELPKVTRNTVLSEAPKSSLTSADIRAPFTMLSDSLSHLGGAVGDIAEKQAERAGYEAVRTDDNGNPVIERSNIPMVGPTADRFERTAKLTYMADIQPKIETEMTRLRLEHPADPDGFTKAANSYITTLTNGTLQDDGTTKGGIKDPALRVAVDKYAATQAAHHARTSMIEADRLNVTEADRAFKARIEGLDNKMAALARQGGVDTTEYKEAASELGSIYRELQTDKRFKFPAERAQQELEHITDRHRGEAVIGTAMQIYDKATPTSAAEAKQWLQEKAFDPALNLKPNERAQIVSRGMAALEGRTAENKALVDANKKLISETIEGLKTSAPTDDRRVNDLMQRSLAIGDVESYYKIGAYKAWQPWRVMLDAAPPGERTDLYRRLTSMQMGGAVTPAFLDRIKQIESGGNARAVTGSYKGLYQMSDAEFAKYGGGDIFNPADNSRAAAAKFQAHAQEFEQKYGRQPTATELYLSHQQGVGGLAAHMANPERPAWENMASTAEGRQKGAAWAKAAVWGNVPDDVKKQFPGGVESLKSGQFMGIWQRKVEGAGGRAAADPGQATLESTHKELVNDYAKRIRGQQEGLVASAERALGAGKTLSPEEIKVIGDSFAIGGPDEKLAERLDRAAEAYDKAHGLLNQPASVRQALRAQMDYAAAGGAGPRERAVAEKVDETIKATEKGMKDTPYSTGALRGFHQPPGAFDFSNPLAVEVEANKRVTDQQVTRNIEQTGPVSVFEGKEAEGLRAALTQGKPEVAAATLAGLGNSLPNDVLRATMTSEPVKQALDGMIRTYDPIRLFSAMSMLDRMWQNQPDHFKQDFGEATLHRLQVWQKWKDVASPAEVAERFKMADDPSKHAAREALGEEAEKELKASWHRPSLDIENISNQFRSAFHVPFTSISPTNSVQAGVLKADFDTIYKDLRQSGLDPKQAADQTTKRLETLWGTSATNGGNLMRHPPEKYYPMVNGSHSWMAKPLEDDLTKALGPRLDRMVTDLGPRATENWRLEGLVADAQTQREILAGRPPSYQVMVKDIKTGRIEAPRDPSNQAMRYRWDAAPVAAAAIQKFTTSHAREEQFLAGKDVETARANRLIGGE